FAESASTLHGWRLCAPSGRIQASLRWINLKSGSAAAAETSFVSRNGGANVGEVNEYESSTVRPYAFVWRNGTLETRSPRPTRRSRKPGTSGMGPEPATCNTSHSCGEHRRGRRPERTRT